jgi:hypothetical protein
MRIAVRSLLLVLVGPTTALAQQPTSRNVAGTGNDIHARIDIQQSRYSVGETACVRVTLVNMSDRTVAYVAMGAADMIHLVVKRNGLLIQPNVRPEGSASAYPARFSPRAALPLAEGRWVPITYWGYKLAEAGEYRIEGIPQISGGFAIADTTTVRSNQVTFTLSRDSTAHASCPQRVEERPKAHKLTPAEVETRSDSLRAATRAKIGAMVETKNWRHDTTGK